MIRELRFIIYSYHVHLCYATVLNPKHGSRKVSKFAFYAELRQKHIQMLELPSSFGLHSTDISHGLPYGPQQGPRAVTGMETHLGEGTATGPPGTSSVGPCDNPWCDGQLNQYATHSSASQGWHTVVNASVYREKNCYYQHFHLRNKKCCMKAHPHPKSFSFSKRSTDQDTSGWGWWTAGSWLKALLHLLSGVLTSKLLKISWRDQ